MLACLAQNGRSRLLSRSEDRILGEITTAQFLSGSLRTKSPAPRSHVRGVPSSVARAFFGAALEPILRPPNKIGGCSRKMHGDSPFVRSKRRLCWHRGRSAEKCTLARHSSNLEVHRVAHLHVHRPAGNRRQVEGTNTHRIGICIVKKFFVYLLALCRRWLTDIPRKWCG